MEPRDLIIQLRYHPWLTTVFVALLIGMHAWVIVPQINIPDPQVDYYNEVLTHAERCNPNAIPYLNPDTNHERNQIKWYFNCISWATFHNPKVLSVAFNIGVMPMVYLVSLALTKDRLISLIAIAAFVNNPLYTDWQGSATYDQAWSFFLLLATYLALKMQIGSLSYGLSILTKGLALMYAPAIMFTSWSVRKSKTDLIFFGMIIIFACLLALQFSDVVGSAIGFYPERIPDALIRNISVLWQVIPMLALVIVLNRSFIPKMKILGEKICFAWIICALIQNPLIYLFTLQDTYSYRYVPLAAFMSILLGITIMNIGNWYAEVQLRKAANKLPL